MTTPAINTPKAIIDTALRNAGKLQEGQLPSSEQYAMYMGDLQRLTNLWQTQGLKLWLQTDLSIPLVTNVDAAKIRLGSQAREALVRQVASPVKWSESIKKLLDLGVTRFVEIGPGRVLSGLVKQISRECRICNIEDMESLRSATAALGTQGCFE